MNNFENNPNHKNVNDIHIQMDRTKNDNMNRTLTSLLLEVQKFIMAVGGA